MWVLEIEPGTFERAATAPNHQAISPAPKTFLTSVFSICIAMVTVSKNDSIAILIRTRYSCLPVVFLFDQGAESLAVTEGEQ